jgi:insulysin
MLLEEYKPELVEMVLKHLTTDTIRVAVISQHFTGKTDKKEKWYGTDYSIHPLPEETLQKWTNAGTHENLKLPTRNEFIPTNFDLSEREKECSSEPQVIKNTDMAFVWYKQDDKFLLPKCCVSLELTSPYAYMDPLSTNLTYMFTSLLQDALNEYSYDAELAGLNYDIHNTIYGLTLGFRGYNDKMHILLQKVIEKMTSFQIDAQRFELLKDNYVRALKNFRAEQPHQHAVYYCSMLTSEQMWTKDELLDAAEEVTVEKVQAFIPQLLSRLYLEFLIYGNTTRERALEIADMIENMLKEKVNTRPLLASQQKRFREVQIPDGGVYLYKSNNEVHRSSALEVYYQCNMQETHNNMVLELFCQVISEPCFDILRTQEQLGYIVFSGVRRSHGIQGLRVIVQSDKTPEYVEGRVEAFLHKMESYMNDMTQESFDNHVEALATKRMEKPKKMSTQNAKFWGEIVSQQYNFERDDLEVNHLRTLKKEDIVNFYKKLIAHDAPGRHKIVIHISSTLVDDKNDTTTATDTTTTDTPSESGDGLIQPPAIVEPVEITDINIFKRGLGLFPLPKPFMDVRSTKSKL